MDFETTYEPDNSLKKGYFLILREIYDELKKNKWLIYQLFKRDFLTIYRQSVFGLLWAFAVPILSLIVFVFLNQSGLFITGVTIVPYPIYALLGLAFWQLFSTGVLACSSSLVQAGSMVTKINFSKKALVIASMGKTLVAFLIQFFLCLSTFALYGIFPNAGIVLTPLLILPLLLFTLGIGLILSVLNGIIRDFGNLVSVLMTFLLFVTPVMYEAPKTGILAQLTPLNPLSYLISVPRDLALTGETSGLIGFLVLSALSLAIFLVGLIAFHLTETRLAERL